MMSKKHIGCLVGFGFVLVMFLLMVAAGFRQCPHQLELPKSRPLVLGLSTDFDVEKVVAFLRLKFSVRDDDLAVEVIRRERMFLKKIPLRHVLVVKNFNTQEFGQREIRCFFLRNRLMSVLFVPKLSEGECKALLKGDYEETVLEGMNLSRERKDASYYQGECTGDDRLEIVDYVWGTEVRSVLLYKAYRKLLQ